MRSYSRISGTSSLDSVTATSGSASRRIRPTRRSWAGFAYAWSRHTPTASIPLGAQPVGEAPHLVGIDRAPHGAVDQDPLVDLEAEVARRDRPRPLHVEVVHVVAVLAGDLDRVAEALGRDERGPGALALDEGVREERGAVEDVRHLAGGHARRAEDGLDPRDHGVVRPVGGGEHLADLERPAVLAGEDQVGEGAADVRAHAVHGVRPARNQSRGQAQTLTSGRRARRSNSGPDPDFDFGDGGGVEVKAGPLSSGRCRGRGAGRRSAADGSATGVSAWR